MNVLVLGATSVIGSEIAAAFAPHNHLLLVGQDPSRLRESAVRCQNAGAESTTALRYDLTAGPQEIVEAIRAWDVHVVVNAASATSRLRDSNVPFERLREYFAVDVSTPLELLQLLLSRGGDKGLRAVFISSVLAVTRSPNRAIYGSLKAIHERALTALAASNPLLRVQIVRVATIIDPERRSRRASSLAKAVRRAFDEERPVLTYGLSGRLSVALYFTQPLVYSVVIRLARWVRDGRRR